MTIKHPPGICLYGNQKLRDKKCPKESAEQITFVNHVRSQHPDSFGLILLHPKNEGLLINGQFSVVSKARAMGMAKGAADIIIPGNPAFVCEIKRSDKTLSTISDEQIAYLYAAKAAGAFVCVALGHAAAIDAFNDWLKIIKPHPNNF